MLNEIIAAAPHSFEAISQTLQCMMSAQSESLGGEMNKFVVFMGDDNAISVDNYLIIVEIDATANISQ